MRSEARADPHPRAARGLILASVAIFLLFSGLVSRQIWVRNEGHFVYALDDPYISLAVSEQVAQGSYGINQGEPSSPCSSVLWPFLLAPFTGSSFQPYAPLALNLLFGTASTAMLAWAVSRWSPGPAHLWSTAWWLNLLAVVLLMFVGNLISLTFIGMEHILQLFVSIACAAGLCELWGGDELPRWAIAAAAFAPLIRYEDLALTAAVSAALLFTRRNKAAVLLFAAAVAPLLLFGVFLHHLGLPILPTSVLMKAYVRPRSSWAGSALWAILRSDYHALLRFGDPQLWPMLALAFLLAGVAWNERDSLRKTVLAGGLVVAVLQLAIGRFGWFHRYEDYALIFVALVFLRSRVGPKVADPAALLALFLLATPYMVATRDTPGASQEAYRLNYQMHRFMADFYRGNAMVNDLGLVSFQRPAGTYVFDLDGLGSLEAAKVEHRTAPWLEKVAAEHDIPLAMVFPVPLQIPAVWTPLAKLCDPDQKVIMPGCVVFYSTAPKYTPELRADVLRFAGTVPKGVLFRLDPARDDIDMNLAYHPFK